MKLNDIPAIRLCNQKIAETEFNTAIEVVGWMGAMQAQDYSMAKLAIGVRLNNSTDEKIESAFNNGEIIRTHLMRPTWHFVAADDVCWMLKLTAGNIKRSIRSRHKELEITPILLTKSNDLIEKSLSKNVFLTREELAVEFIKANINLDNNRLSHLLLCAELDGIACSGPLKGRKQTYALLHKRVQNPKFYTREESLAELAKRYFTSHGPATLHDFVWWSGLPVTDAKQGLESIKSYLISEIYGTKEYWLPFSSTTYKQTNPSVHYLPAFDEFLISYRDRSASLALVHNKKAVSDNGIFRPVILINGQVAGIWRRSTKKDHVLIEATFFQLPDEKMRDRLDKATTALELYFGKEIRICYPDDDLLRNKVP